MRIQEKKGLPPGSPCEDQNLPLWPEKPPLLIVVPPPPPDEERLSDAIRVRVTLRLMKTSCLISR
jgi:hypothetical protein